MTNNRQTATDPMRVPRERLGHNPSIPPVLTISIAKEIASILRQRNIHFAFCEDVAAYVYGVTRWVPRSIRIMVLLSEVDAKTLAQSFSVSNPECWAFSEKSGTLAYHVTMRSKSFDTDASHSILVSLTPTTRHPLHSAIFLIDTLPLVPFTFILLEQLLEWDESPSGLIQNKARAVMVMLAYLQSHSSKPHCKAIQPFDPILHYESWDRVSRFYGGINAYLSAWQMLGFMQERRPSFDDAQRISDDLAAMLINAPLAESSASSLSASDIDTGKRCRCVVCARMPVSKKSLPWAGPRHR